MKICAIVVTFRRRELLRQCISGLIGQTRPPDVILVIDNANEMDLPEMLHADFGECVSCVSSAQNLGPAGGYALGTTTAYRQGFDWSWLMDDDCEPAPDALEKLLTALGEAPASPVALVSCHIRDGRPVGSASGTFDLRRCRLVLLPESKCAKGIHRVDAASSSGMFVNLRFAAEAGFQNADLFLLEDADFSWRLGRLGPIFHVGASQIKITLPLHHGLNKRWGYWRASRAQFWRSYYSFRNDVRFYLSACPGRRTQARMIYRYLHAVVGIFLFDDHKWWRARLLTRALLDGWSGRMGRVLDPEQF